VCYKINCVENELLSGVVRFKRQTLPFSMSHAFGCNYKIVGYFFNMELLSAIFMVY
jgi:hypothetical protein